MSSPVLPPLPPITLPGAPGNSSSNTAQAAINGSTTFSSFAALRTQEPALYKAIIKGMGEMMMNQMKSESDQVVKAIKQEEEDDAAQ